MKNLKSLFFFLFFLFWFISITFAVELTEEELAVLRWLTTWPTIVDEFKKISNEKGLIVDNYYKCVDNTIDNDVEVSQKMSNYMTCYSKFNKDYSSTIRNYDSYFKVDEKILKAKDRYTKKLSRCIKFNNFIRKNVYNQVVWYENCYLKFRECYEN